MINAAIFLYCLSLRLLFLEARFQFVAGCKFKAIVLLIQETKLIWSYLFHVLHSSELPNSYELIHGFINRWGQSLHDPLVSLTLIFDHIFMEHHLFNVWLWVLDSYLNHNSDWNSAFHSLCHGSISHVRPWDKKWEGITFRG